MHFALVVEQLTKKIYDKVFTCFILRGIHA